MPEKVLVLTAVYANDTFVVGAFTDAAKLTEFTQRHTAAEMTGAPLAEYQDPQAVKVDAE